MKHINKMTMQTRINSHAEKRGPKQQTNESYDQNNQKAPE